MHMLRRKALPTVRAVLALLLFSLVSANAPVIMSQSTNAPQYHLIKKVVLGGEGAWDYFTVDPATHRIFIARGTHVMVVDPDGKLVADIQNPKGTSIGSTLGAHAVELAPDLKLGFTSNGGASSVTIFDLAALKILGQVAIPGRDTDAILYDPSTKRAFTFNGRDGNDATAIDPKTQTVLGNIPLGGKPETAQTDGKGDIFVNIENKSELREIDAAKLEVTHTWPLAPCKNPSGQAIDVEHSLLVIGCHNGLMEFWDYAHGKVAGTLPIGQGVDANRFDPGTGLAFASCGDGTGTITVAHVDSPTKFRVVQSITTMKGARTMALDTSNHNIYTVTSEFGPPPAPTPSNPHPWPSIKPDTFTLMIYSLQ